MFGGQAMPVSAETALAFRLHFLATNAPKRLEAGLPSDPLEELKRPHSPTPQ